MNDDRVAVVADKLRGHLSRPGFIRSPEEAARAISSPPSTRTRRRHSIPPPDGCKRTSRGRNHGLRSGMRSIRLRARSRRQWW